YAGLSGGRITEVYQTRAFSSSIGLWMLAWLSQMASSPQNTEGMVGFPGRAVFGSRTGILIVVAVFRTGSRTGRLSVESSVAPYSGPLALIVGLRLSVAISSCI